MAENVLDDVLNGETDLEKIFSWILSAGTEVKQEFKYSCSQGEFLSFFLNYIHEEAAIIDKSNDTPQKVHTPKSIRKLDTSRSDSKIKKRPALFTESKKQTLEARILQSTSLDNSLNPICNKSSSSPNSSTPKTKSNMHYEANTSYSSPISPIYTKMMLQTPKNRQKPVQSTKSSEKCLCLGDYLANTRKTSAAKKKVNRNLSNLQENLEPQIDNRKTRRINPTNLSQSKFKDNFHKSGNSFNFSNDSLENGIDVIKSDLSPNVVNNVEIIKVTRNISQTDIIATIQSPKQNETLLKNNLNSSSIAQNFSTPKKNLNNGDFSSFSRVITKLDNYSALRTPNKLSLLGLRKEINPCFNNVTNKKCLDIIVKIYDFILNNNLALNITSEIYFIITLILTNQYESETNIDLADSLKDNDMEVNDHDCKSSLSDQNHMENLNNLTLGDDSAYLLENHITNKSFGNNQNGVTNNGGICYKSSNLSDKNIISSDLIQTSTISSDLGNKITSKNIFTSLHNTVYFACQVLELQIDALKLLDRTGLKLLLENKRFELLSALSYERLAMMYDEKVEEKKEFCETGPGNVCFMSDTDNRENFPTEVSFHAFRKQRDLFYEILRIWEECHLEDGWSFVSLAGKIRTLLNLHSDSGNFRHFCRLFKAQLLGTCSKRSENALQVNQLSFLSTIPNINSEKLSRLKNRLITKTSSNGINATPTFPGLQEFYKEFIVFAAAHVFNAHLKDALICEILQLNDTKFCCIELEEKDTIVDEETKKSYLLCLNSLRLLAKFLGFLESIPYRLENTNISEKIGAAEIQMRDWLQPNFDLKKLLQDSIESETLILSIPWIAKYLSMLDYITLRLPYFYAIYGLLFQTYSNLKMTKAKFNNTMLIRLSLGWLFELPNFPSEHYYQWCSSQKLQRTPAKKEGKSAILDNLEIVDRDVLSACCPYLDEFKKLLQSNSGNHNKLTVKHITPVTALECAVDVNEKRIKIQLEEAFFNAQPLSMRKTVEFVSERIASACVKTICNQIVPDFKAAAIADYKNMVAILHTGCCEAAADEEAARKMFKQVIKTKSNVFLHETTKRLLGICANEIEKQVREKIPSTIVLLLSDEELQQTKQTCIFIATRITKDRIQQWVNSHVNIGIFTKDFDNEVLRTFDYNKPKENKLKPVFALPSGGKDILHNSTTLCAVRIAEQIRDLTSDVLEHSNNVSRERIVNLLESAERSMNGRCDINECILVHINRLFLDLLLLIVAHKTELCSGDLIIKFVNFWKQFLSIHTTDLFELIVCPRNVMLLGQSQDVSKAWVQFSKFLAVLIENGVLGAEQFESQCVAIYQHSWNDFTLRLLSNCFKDVGQNGGRQNGAVSQMVDFLTDYCVDMED